MPRLRWGLLSTARITRAPGSYETLLADPAIDEMRREPAPDQRRFRSPGYIH
jgi:hypothetical protein